MLWSMKKPKGKEPLSELVLAAMKYFVKPSTAESIGNYIDWKDHGRFVHGDIMTALTALESAGSVEKGRVPDRWQLVARARPPKASKLA
jgi:hypothetical protein